MRRRVCELVAGIIATDQELHPAELRFMLRTFERFGIATGADDEALCPAVSCAAAARAMAQLPEAMRRETMELLIESAVVDGKVVPAERTLLEAVANAAGLPLDDIDDRLTDALLAVDPSS